MTIFSKFNKTDLEMFFRKPKFFFVSSTTSTTISTTTSVVGAKATCLILSKTKYTACKRRRRSLSITDEDIIDSGAPITISRVERYNYHIYQYQETVDVRRRVFG